MAEYAALPDFFVIIKKMDKMRIKNVWKIVVVILLLSPCLGHAADLTELFKQVERLRIERSGYVLGAVLTNAQLKAAAANPMEAGSKDTFKFRDKTLFVVAQKNSNRVLVIYELFETASQKKIQDIIGDLYMGFDDPTVLAHDKVVYWAYTKKGKITAKEFETARQEKKKLSILATVKFISDINIMEKIKEPEPATGRVYYIISSDPVLKFFKTPEP